MPHPADRDDKRPSGLPDEESEKRRVSEPPSEKLVPLRPPMKVDIKEAEREATLPPPGLGEITTSARLRLQLAVDEEIDEPDRDSQRPEVKKPAGLKNMTTSARMRLELALEYDDEADPTKPPVIAKERLSKPGDSTIRFDTRGRRVVRSLLRWMAFCGLLTMAIGALTGLSYLTGEGSVAHVVIGILASAVSIWQLLAVWSLRNVLKAGQQHHMVHALGHIRSALLLKSILVFAAMVLGCFTFSIAGSLLFLLG